MRKLFTIGYERSSLLDFIATLEIAGVDLLLDVREFPVSRRKGFSKSALRDALEGSGIDYRHEKSLGSPKDIRHRLYDDGDFEQFFTDFRVHLETQKGLLRELANDLSGNVALMCYERDPRTCHRTVVAEAFQSIINDLPLKNLGVKEDAASESARTHLGQSLPAV